MPLISPLMPVLQQSTSSIDEICSIFLSAAIFFKLGRLPKVDLIILEGENVRPSVRPPVRPSLRLSVHKKFLRFQ